MAVGQNLDVSKKLKAAIKAKLEELGVYVDDELPEYIMVMIANKKEKNQMKDDLNLFLGKCTNKFVDWLFELFERLQSAGSKPDTHSTSEKSSKEVHKEPSKEKERKREPDSHLHASTSKKEERKERVRQAEKAKEKEREERVKEAERQQKLREQEKLKSRTEASRSRETVRPTRRQKERRSRSRSRTWSEEEFEHEVEERTKKVTVASSVIAQRPLAASPEPVKVSSQVHVMRKVKPAVSEIEKKTMKAGSSMFLKAMNQASVSAGYGASLVDKKKAAAHATTSRSPLKNRISRPAVVEVDSDGENTYDAEVVVGDKSRTRSSSPQITVTLKGAKEHIGSLGQSKRGNLKRRKEKDDGGSKSGSVVVVPEKRGRTVEIDEDLLDGSDSPSVRKWDGQIQLDEDDSTDDDEAKIDAVLADARGVSSSMDEDGEVPPTHQLSRGNSWSGYAPSPSHQSTTAASNYVPTPLTKEEQTFQSVTKIPERCRFWPNCRQGESCAYTHPTKQCINFPHCSFGARCLYIHPPCRFDRNCANPSCPYTHGRIAAAVVPVVVTTAAVVAPQAPQPVLTSSANTITASEPAKIAPDVPLSADPNPVPSLASLTPCLYGNKCRRPNCAFKHPKTCHYGASCMNANCYFYHPPQPKPSFGAGVAKYKWKASSATA
ncbi:hypothetical protein ANCCAN_02974 [Ancylostoma caninum]|uniref:Zinc finger CCCH domain-containing protein 14 n=2 Tax=Ancylostoma caninum TaxID=29170 RepID=A0A368H2Y9_ANCCA|nr:hypothetical protein ANCCAN_02974 [Ancylostoma caninum]